VWFLNTWIASEDVIVSQILTQPPALPLSATIPTSEEMLVPDARAQLTPAQMVENKLVAMMETSSMLVSHLQDSVRHRPR
jgi:hypothetical protein